MSTCTLIDSLSVKGCFEPGNLIIMCIIAWMCVARAMKSPMSCFTLIKTEMCCVKCSFLLKWNRHRYDNFHFLKIRSRHQQLPFTMRGILEPYVVRLLVDCFHTSSNQPLTRARFEILISPWMSQQHTT